MLSCGGQQTTGVSQLIQLKHSRPEAVIGFKHPGPTLAGHPLKSGLANW